MKFYTLFISLMLAISMILYGGEAKVAEADGDNREYKLKAAFLLNFSKFTSWPDEAFAQSSESFNFCVLSEDPFSTILNGLENKKVGGRSIELHYPDSPAEQKRCQVIFISRLERNKLDQLQQLADEYPIMTVSDIKGFSRSGGTIEFVTRAGKLSFIVNNSKAQKNGLQINASLLNLAANVL